MTGITGATRLVLTGDLRSRLDEASAKQWTDAELVNWVNEGIKDVSAKSLFDEKTANLTTVASQAPYALPDDFIALKRATYFSTATDERRLRRITFFDLDQNYPFTSQTGDPTGWYLYGTNIYFYPAPATSSKTIKLYYAGFSVLATDAATTTIPLLFSDLPVLYGLYVAKQKEEEWGTSEQMRATYMERLQEFINWWKQGRQEYDLPVVADSYSIPEDIW